MNPMMSESLYLVQEKQWTVMVGTDGPYYNWSQESRDSVVEAFVDREEAEACCTELERQKRAEVNPFEYCETVDELTHFDAERLHDWILDAGLEPPPEEQFIARGPWRVWWAEQRPNMTELQRAKMWQALDKLRFFRVVELLESSTW